jgi:hypothetical protein
MPFYVFTVVVFPYIYLKQQTISDRAHSMAKKLDLNTAPTLIGLVVDVDLIRFERNLIALGFFGANDRSNQSKTTRRIEQEVTRGDRRIKVAWEFRGSEKLGLPSTADRDKFIAFLKIANEGRARNGTISNPIRFSGYRMIAELGLSRHGEIYEDILEWGKRMADTTITSEQMVYLAAKKIYTDKTIHVFRSFERTGTHHSGGEKQETYEVIVEDWLLENLNHRYVIPEDFNAYKKLSKPTAKGIFGHLHLWFHASDGRPVEKDYADLCALLNLTAYTKPSRIKSTIGKALDEFVNIKYLAKWELRTRVTKDGFKLILFEGEELSKFRDSQKQDKRLNGTKSSDEQVMSESQMQALKVLLDNGVLPAKARPLAARYELDKVLDTVDYVMSLAQGRRNRVENPAGLIIYHLENGLSVPPTFVSHRKEAERAEARKQEQERLTAIAELEETYLQWTDERVEEEIKVRYSQAELKARLRQIIAELRNNDDLKGYFRTSTEAQKEQMAMQVFRREIKEELALPLFGEWAEKHEQPSLFQK